MAHQEHFVEHQPRLCPACGHTNHDGQPFCKLKLHEARNERGDKIPDTVCGCEYGSPKVTEAAGERNEEVLRQVRAASVAEKETLIPKRTAEDVEADLEEAEENA